MQGTGRYPIRDMIMDKLAKLIPNNNSGATLLVLISVIFFLVIDRTLKKAVRLAIAIVILVLMAVIVTHNSGMLDTVKEKVLDIRAETQIQEGEGNGTANFRI